MLRYNYTKLYKTCLGNEFYILKFHNMYPGSSFLLNPDVLRDTNYTQFDRVSLLALASLRKYPEYKFFGQIKVPLLYVPDQWDLSLFDSSKLIDVGNKDITLISESK